MWTLPPAVFTWAELLHSHCQNFNILGSASDVMPTGCPQLVLWLFDACVHKTGKCSWKSQALIILLDCYAAAGSHVEWVYFSLPVHKIIFKRFWRGALTLELKTFVRFVTSNLWNMHLEKSKQDIVSVLISCALFSDFQSFTWRLLHSNLNIFFSMAI